jgi:hypothetical protein
LTPVLMPGLPVLVAALVAVVFGVLNLFGERAISPRYPSGRRHGR